jgi:hypothetical protein
MLTGVILTVAAVAVTSAESPLGAAYDMLHWEFPYWGLEPSTNMTATF